MAVSDCVNEKTNAVEELQMSKKKKDNCDKHDCENKVSMSLENHK